MDFLITDVCFLVDDIERSIAFYQEKVGLKLIRRDQWMARFDTGEATFSLRQAEKFSQELGVGQITEKGHRCIGAFQFDTGEEVSTYYRSLYEKGVKFVTDLVDWPWGARAAYFVDPDGFLWEIYAWVGKPYTW